VKYGFLDICIVLASIAIAVVPADAGVPAQSVQSMADICKLPGYTCINQAIEVRLVKKDGSVFDHSYDPPTAVIQHGNQINLFAGQTLNVEVNVLADGSLANFHLVRKIVHPRYTLTFEFKQIQSDNAGWQMLLVIHNPFKRWLKYRAGYMLLSPDLPNFYATSVCPVIPGGKAAETWPYPIFQLELLDLRLVRIKGNTITCEK
jgi:hypothetical protein